MTPAEQARLIAERYGLNGLEERALAEAVGEAVAAERERCARVVESFDAVSGDGERVNPGLGYWREWRGGDAEWVPDAEAIAARIRKGVAG